MMMKAVQIITAPTQSARPNATRRSNICVKEGLDGSTNCPSGVMSSTGPFSFAMLEI